MKNYDFYNNVFHSQSLSCDIALQTPNPNPASPQQNTATVLALQYEGCVLCFGMCIF